MKKEEREQQIDDFEKNHYPLSSLLKERLLETTEERFANKMNELLYYATQGSVFTFAK